MKLVATLVFFILIDQIFSIGFESILYQPTALGKNEEELCWIKRSMLRAFFCEYFNRKYSVEDTSNRIIFDLHPELKKIALWIFGSSRHEVIVCMNVPFYNITIVMFAIQHNCKNLFI